VITILPYLKRKDNYCSRRCYWDLTRKSQKRRCLICGKQFIAKNFLLKQGFGIYCSRKCQHETYPKKIRKICIQCGKRFVVWPAKADKAKFCSKKCSDDYKRDYVKSICKNCGKTFSLSRSNFNRGRGSFCSRDCFFRYRGPSSLEEKMERALVLARIKFRREVKFQRFYVDFLIESKKLIIECDGEYWHMNSRIQERDKRKERLLNSLGYLVFRFSGTSIGKISDEVLAAKVREMVG
jgi:very-short-patch-repair endonuclease